MERKSESKPKKRQQLSGSSPLGWPSRWSHTFISTTSTPTSRAPTCAITSCVVVGTNWSRIMAPMSRDLDPRSTGAGPPLKDTRRPNQGLKGRLPPRPLRPRPHPLRPVRIARPSWGPKPPTDNRAGASTAQCGGTSQRNVQSHTDCVIVWEGANVRFPEITSATALSSNLHALMWASTAPPSSNRWSGVESKMGRR